MTDNGRDALLANIALFDSLTDDDIAALSQRVEAVDYEPGDVIFHQGDEGSSLFAIEEGSVEISFGEGRARVVLATLFTGQYFGELSLFDGSPRSATATAAKRSRVIRLDRDDLVDYVNKNPAAALRIIAEMSDRLRQTNELMSQQVARNVLDEADEKMTLGQRVADRVATFGGSWPFIFIFGVVMLGWMAINIAQLTHFDPYPFILLNLCLSTLAAIQAPIIMMSQNRQASKDKLLAENDYQVNRKAEMEIGAVLRNQAEVLARLALVERLVTRRGGVEALNNNPANHAPQALPSAP
jgi:CRP/FNR family cyclic AMP-dependent transcriptional regulator